MTLVVPCRASGSSIASGASIASGKQQQEEQGDTEVPFQELPPLRPASSATIHSPPYSSSSSNCWNDGSSSFSLVWRRRSWSSWRPSLPVFFSSAPWNCSSLNNDLNRNQQQVKNNFSKNQQQTNNELPSQLSSQLSSQLPSQLPSQGGTHSTNFINPTYKRLLASCCCTTLLFLLLLLVYATISSSITVPHTLHTFHQILSTTHPDKEPNATQQQQQQQFLQTAEHVVQYCNEETMKSSLGRLYCRQICHDHLCCFDDTTADVKEYEYEQHQKQQQQQQQQHVSDDKNNGNKYNCVNDDDKLCPVYAACEILVMEWNPP